MPWGQDEADLVWTNLDLICNPKESKAQETEKNKETKKNKDTKKTHKETNKTKHTMFSRLVWTCLDPSSPQNIVFCSLFVFLFVMFFLFVFFVLGD